MFCPKCKVEYENWVKECADCKVPLVSELPPEQKQEDIEYEEVLSTFNQGDVAMIKPVLDSENIMYHFKNEYFNLARPLVQPTILMVRKDQLQKAKDILKGYNLRYFGVVKSEDREDKVS